MRFKGKGVLVTGCGGGIGREACLQFAAEGGIVAATDVDRDMAQRTADAVAEAGGTAFPFVLDVTDPKAVATTIEAAAGKLGSLDVIVNNAGIREIVPVLDLSYEEWKRVIDINVDGVFLCSQAFARHVVKAGRKGAIVNLASTLGISAAPKRAAYTTSKHAVVGLTREMALELGEHGIRVNAVGPGVTRTPMTERYFQDPDYAQTIRNVHSGLGRWGEASEIAKAILFLASDEASFVTGHTLIVDGGWTIGKKF